MAAPACYTYDDGSSTESEYYFEPEEEEELAAAGVPLGGGDASVRPEQQQQQKEEEGASSSGVAAFPSPSVTDGAKRPGSGSSAGGDSRPVKTATVTDSDSSTEAAAAAASGRKKPRTGERERVAAVESAGKAGGVDAKKQAPRIVRLARPREDRAASSAVRRLSGSLRQSLPAITTDVHPLLEKIDQGLSNPRPGSKRSLPSSEESSPRRQEGESKRRRGAADSATRDSCRVVHSSRGRSGSRSRSHSRQRADEKRSHSRDDDVSRASRGEDVQQASRSDGRRSRDELPPRKKSSSSHRSSSEHRSQRSDQDRLTSAGASTSTSKSSYSDRAYSDSRRSSSHHEHKERSDARPSSSNDYSTTRDPRRSSPRHIEERHDTYAKSYPSEYPSGDSLRDPRRSSSLHPERLHEEESRGNGKTSSSSKHDSSRDPWWGSSSHSEARTRGKSPEKGTWSDERQNSSKHTSGASDPRRSSSRHPDRLREEELRSGGRPSSSEYSSSRDPRRGSSHHPEERHGEETRSDERPSSKYRSSGSHDPRRSSSLHPEGQHGEETRSDERPSSKHRSSGSHDPRRSSSLHPEGRHGGEIRKDERASNEYGHSRDSRRSYSVHPDCRIRGDRTDARPTSEYDISRDPRRGESRHPEVRHGEKFRSDAQASGNDYNISRDPRRDHHVYSDHQSRDPRQSSNNQRSESRRSLERHREDERIERRGRGVDEYESKHERAELYRSSSQHPELMDDAVRAPPSRGYDDSGSQQYREAQELYPYHTQNDQHPIYHAGEQSHRDGYVFGQRDDREYPPRQEYSRSRRTEHTEPAPQFGRPERTLQSPRGFGNGLLDRRFGSLQAERRQPAGFEQPPPPGHQAFDQFPDYYVSGQHIESPRPKSVDPVGTWRDPRRDPRARQDLRTQTVAPASSFRSADMQPVPAQYHQEYQEQASIRAPPVQVSLLQRSRSVDPRRARDDHRFPEQGREDRVRDPGFSRPLAQGPTPASRHREYDAVADHTTPAARDPRQLNASGKRPRPTSTTTDSYSSPTIAAMIAARQINQKYVLDVGRFKLTTKFAEIELMNPNSVHKHEYLLMLQGNLRMIKLRLEKQHPTEFPDVFDAVRVTEEQIRRFGERKAFAVRMQNFLRDQQKFEKYCSEVGKNGGRKVELIQRRLDEEREQLAQANPGMFDRMLQQWDPKQGRCVFTKPFHEEWGDV